ncbi:MAG: hypothetical protein JXA28_01635 [Bacteroidetes bacterium]|nr:hypothetical protein [Bacteroidota bacterium]
MRTLLISLTLVALVACSGKKHQQENAGQEKALPEGAQVVGLWTDPTPVEPGQIMIYTGKDGKSVARTILAGNNGFYEFEVRENNEGAERRFDYVEEMHGEYFVIDSEGYLEFRNAEGKEFATGVPLEYSPGK